MQAGKTTAVPSTVFNRSQSLRVTSRSRLGEAVTFPTRAHQTSGVILLHPGRGFVKRVAGVTQAHRLPGVLEVSCRVSTGETLTRREGSGESAAHIIATGKTRADVVKALTLARRALVVELEHRESHHGDLKRSDMKRSDLKRTDVKPKESEHGEPHKHATRSGNGTVQRNPEERLSQPQRLARKPSKPRKRRLMVSRTL